MQRWIRRAVVAVAAPLAIVAGVATAAGTASAAPGQPATIGCQNQASAGCGHEQMKFGHYNLDVYQQHAVSGNKVVLWTKSTTDPAQDWLIKNYNGQSGSGGPDKTFEYAPDGRASGLCLSFPSESRGTFAELRNCNQGIWQTFEPQYIDGNYVEWKNLASGYVWDNLGFGNQGTRLGQWTLNGGDNQEVKYTLAA